MLFCSLQYLGFFAAVFALYWALPWQRARVWLLLAASFYFYASWNRWLALIIVASTTVDYLLAHGIAAAPSARLKRLLVALSVGANLGLLCYFKYVNFFLDSLADLLRSCGAEASLPTLSVLLPIGISFYTFEAINYVVDVYRGHVRPERSLANFALFILFFPHLVAGPIVRARDFLPQIARRKRLSWGRAHLGMQYLLMGLFKKLAIADRMALFADPVFADPASYATHALWLAALAYALQVYRDFSGYTDMALGCAHLLDYRLAQNFNLPYLAANISEFWRRWHISLSSWLRDYLFVPLGGSQHGRWRTYRNLIVVMTLGGLWHGAAWNFVAFGLIQGCWLSLHRAFRDWCRQRPALDGLLRSVPGTVLRVATTFTLFTCSLVVFRAVTLGLGFTMLGRMLGPHSGLGVPLHASGLLTTLTVVAVCHALAWNDLWRRLLQRVPAPVRGFGYAAVLTLALLLAPETNMAFIYFQF